MCDSDVMIDDSNAAIDYSYATIDYGDAEVSFAIITFKNIFLVWGVPFLQFMYRRDIHILEDIWIDG